MIHTLGGRISKQLVGGFYLLRQYSIAVLENSKQSLVRFFHTFFGKVVCRSPDKVDSGIESTPTYFFIVDSTCLPGHCFRSMVVSLFVACSQMFVAFYVDKYYWNKLKN